MTVPELQAIADDLFKNYDGSRTRLAMLLVDLAQRLEASPNKGTYKIRNAIEDDYYTLLAHFDCSHADVANGTIDSGAGDRTTTT